MTKELTHADLERHHYEALKDPLYAAQGMTDVRLEELSMNMPIPPDGETEPVSEKVQEFWNKKQWDIVNQLRAEVKHIHAEVHEKKAKKRTSKYD